MRGMRDAGYAGYEENAECAGSADNAEDFYLGGWTENRDLGG